MDERPEKLDVSERLGALLKDLAEAVAKTGSTDSMALIVSSSSVRASFTALCRELREVGETELALVEFGPIKDRGNVLMLSDPMDHGNWPVWNVLVSADTQNIIDC